MKYKELRKKYPKFIYRKYFYQIKNRDLKIFFDFEIEPGIFFRPEIIIKNINKRRIAKRVVESFIFHLGLIEALSYWKATCSPVIEIQAGFLNQEQVKFWKDLIINGMGQFFYENKIDFRKSNFFKIISSQKFTKKSTIVGISANLKNRVLVPVGGGKDSIVTLEILSSFVRLWPSPSVVGFGRRRTEDKEKIACFALNPTPAAIKIIKTSGSKNPIVVERKLDKKLLELNRKGFLNGHTPFSAYLAFLSLLLAYLLDFKYIAFSNERSSNEGNVKYLGKIINHQYSKSFDFERKFRSYYKKYLSKNFTPHRARSGGGIEYFSFLRSLYEIQIAKLFSKYEKYFPVFLSCNESQKTDSGRKKPTGKWCCNCPKCLFVFASLYPFLGEKKLIKIFGQNLFKKKELLPTMLELIGERKFKPFECVGTKKESLIAFYLSWKKAERIGEGSFLLNYFKKKTLPKYQSLERESRKIINSWHLNHNIPRPLDKLLRDAIIKGERR